MDRVIGHYRLTRKLGAGGMGEVYLAEDTTLKRNAAVKLLPAQMGSDTSWRQRFLEEARLASALNHPGIATIYEAGVEEGSAYIAMEYVEGLTLRERLKKPITRKEALSIAKQVALALSAAHRAGVVHHDVKPGNIMLLPGGTVKLLDFGLARRQQAPVPHSEDAETLITAGSTGSFSGTPGYAAPEQIEMAPTDGRADLFSLGAVLYEMLAGRAPFQGRNLHEQCNAVLTETPPPLTNVPESLARLVSRCIEKDPALRYQCTADLAFDLESLRDSASTPVPAIRKHQAAWIGSALIAGILLGASLLFLRPARRGYWKLPGNTPRILVQMSDDAALSPDGTQVAYVSERELYLQSIGGGDTRKLTSDGQAKEGPHFSQDGKRILFTRRRSAGTQSSNLALKDIYVMELPAGLPRLLVEDATGALWSPDGRQLAFLRHQELMIGDAEGKNPRSLEIQASTNRYAVAWSPDGKELAAMYGAKIILVPASGGKSRELPDEKAATEVAYSPDGQFLIVGGLSGIRVYPRNGGPAIPFATGDVARGGLTIAQDGTKLLAPVIQYQLRVVTTEPSMERVDSKVREIPLNGNARNFVALSPDEKQIIYREWRLPDFHLWAANVDGSEQRLVLANIRTEPNLSPDGKTLLAGGDKLRTLRFDEGVLRTSDRLDHIRSPNLTADGQYFAFEKSLNIAIAPYAGGPMRMLTDSGFCQLPAVSPVGTKIAYLHGSPDGMAELRIVDYAGGENRMIVSQEDLGKPMGYAGPVWSRDGKYLFVNREQGLMRVPATGGKLEKFSFPLENIYAVSSDYRKIYWTDRKSITEVRLYEDLR